MLIRKNNIQIGVAVLWLAVLVVAVVAIAQRPVKESPAQNSGSVKVLPANDAGSQAVNGAASVPNDTATVNDLQGATLPSDVANDVTQTNSSVNLK